MNYFMNFKKYLKNKNRGFTLIEILVSSAIFILVIGVVVNVYLNMINRQRRVVDAVQALDNARLSLEAMSRLIRTGKDIEKSGGPNKISFTDQKGRRVTFAKHKKNILQTIDADSFDMISDPNIEVSDIDFIKRGLSNDDQEQPSVTIIIGLKYKFNNKDIVTTLQTSVSQRKLDFDTTAFAAVPPPPGLPLPGGPDGTDSPVPSPTPPLPPP